MTDINKKFKMIIENEDLFKSNPEVMLRLKYLVDNKSKLANTFNAKTTPHIFLFDETNKLVYKGSIDNNYKDKSNVTEFYLN